MIFAEPKGSEDEAVSNERKNIEEIDKNFAAEKVSYEGMTVWRLPAAPFEIRGLYRAEQGDYRRLPHQVAAQCSEALQQMYLCTSGGRIRFRTDSSRFVIRCVETDMRPPVKQPLIASNCFDLYTDGCYRGAFRPDFSAGGHVSRQEYYYRPGYEGMITLRDGRKMREVLIHFPLYSDVKDVWIALEEDAVVAPPTPYLTERPVGFYGSSITQGGCAAHPGNAYPAILSQRLNADFLNLGFSSGGKGEQVMADYVAGLSMSALVMDYDHNAPSAEHLWHTHEPFFKTVRAAQPELPIIMLSATDAHWGDTTAARREAIRATYDYAVAAGDRNVWFIDGQTVFADFGGSGMCTVDHTHPNDLGFWCYVRALEPLLRGILHGAM